MAIKTISLQRRQKGRATNVPVNDYKRHKDTHLSHPRPRQPVPLAKDHIPSGCVKSSKQNPFASVFERSYEHPYASTASGRGIQREIATSGHVGRAENDIIRCCIGQNTTQGLVPVRPVQNPLLQTVDAQHLLCHPIHHPLATDDTQTTNRRRREQPRLQAHLPVTDEHMTNDSDNRRIS